LIIEAVKSYPEMVAGTNRYCTDMMRICGDEIVGKTGAEGVYCMTLYNKKIGVCIKIDDGKMLPQYNVAQAFISSIKLFPIEKLTPLHKYLQEDILNWNQLKTGVLKPSELLLTELNRQFI
jgi:L-asparaginase II